MSISYHTSDRAGKKLTLRMVKRALNEIKLEKATVKETVKVNVYTSLLRRREKSWVRIKCS